MDEIFSECFISSAGDYVYQTGIQVGGIKYEDPDETGEDGEALWSVVDDIQVTHTYDKDTKTLQLTCSLDNPSYNESSKIYWLKNRMLTYITNRAGENWGLANYKGIYKIKLSKIFTIMITDISSGWPWNNVSAFRQLR